LRFIIWRYILMQLGGGLSESSWKIGFDKENLWVFSLMWGCEFEWGLGSRWELGLRLGVVRTRNPGISAFVATQQKTLRPSRLLSSALSQLFVISQIFDWNAS
jgi:hypothetical protein